MIVGSRKLYSQNPIGTLCRHGDVLIKRVANLPPGSQKRSGNILAHGEVTGHSHRIRQAEAMQLWEQNNTMFLEVIGEKATLVHEEHRPLELTKGIYQVWRQREYRPDRYVEVED